MKFNYCYSEFNQLTQAFQTSNASIQGVLDIWKSIVIFFNFRLNFKFHKQTNRQETSSRLPSHIVSLESEQKNHILILIHLSIRATKENVLLSVHHTKKVVI